MTQADRDIIEDALKIVNLLDEYGSADAALYARALKQYTALHEILVNTYKVRWASDSVPDQYAPHVAGMLAGRLVRAISAANREKGQEAEAVAKVELHQVLSRKPRKTVQVQAV